jgi:hypothetical protein
MEPRWGDPEAPWWAKLRRAKSHISEVRQQVHALQVAEPWSVQREPAGPGGWAYRFRVHKSVPADLAAATGDAVANMRAALDNIAYELARHHAGTMSDAEERATFFPICENKATFEKFFQHPLRSNLYSDTERRALQCVQPFARADEMREHGVEPGTDPKSDLLTDHAYALNTIWNIDKHRRLPELAWAAEGPVWFEEMTGCRWRGDVSGVTLLPDGGVLGELHGPAGSGRPQAELNYTIDLVLTDDPSPGSTPPQR